MAAAKDNDQIIRQLMVENEQLRTLLHKCQVGKRSVLIVAGSIGRYYWTGEVRTGEVCKASRHAEAITARKVEYCTCFLNRNYYYERRFMCG